MYTRVMLRHCMNLNSTIGRTAPVREGSLGKLSLICPPSNPLSHNNNPYYFTVKNLSKAENWLKL